MQQSLRNSLSFQGATLLGIRGTLQLLCCPSGRVSPRVCRMAKLDHDSQAAQHQSRHCLVLWRLNRANLTFASSDFNLFRSGHDLRKSSKTPLRNKGTKEGREGGRKGGREEGRKQRKMTSSDTDRVGPPFHCQELINGTWKEAIAGVQPQVDGDLLAGLWADLITGACWLEVKEQWQGRGCRCPTCAPSHRGCFFDALRQHELFAKFCFFFSRAI